MNIWLPFRGEFGAKLLWFVPTFHVAPHPKLICCEPHQECLYPSADEFYIVPLADPSTTAAHGAPGDAELFEEIKKHFGPDRNYINPHQSGCFYFFLLKPLKQYDIYPDVVLCKRMKGANGGKIWGHWDKLKEDLESSDIKVYVADNYNTDEIIWAMQHAKIVLSVQTGSMWLSVLSGKKVHILCTEDELEGDPANQGVEIERLKRMAWEVRLNDEPQDKYKLIPHWHNYDKVLESIKEELCCSH